jgi:hypothetical protein
MSVAYFIVLDNDDPGFETMVNGKAVAHATGVINKFAAKLKLKTIDELTSFGELDEEFDVPDELRETETPWFEAKEGIAWVSAIRKHIEANRSSVKDAERVISDLQEYEQVLTQAAKIGAKWHFQLDL